MGFNVHMHVCFNCDDNGPVAELAKKHLAILPVDAQPESRYFLECLSGRSGINPGTKGGVSLWGIVGHASHVEYFVKYLIPFCGELLSDDRDDGVGRHEHVIVFYEPEESGAAGCYEIGYEFNEQDFGPLQIRHHDRLPFCWNQY